MAELTKNDLQQIVDGARRQILDRVIDRQEIVRINEDVRNRLMNYTQDLLQVQQQQLRRRYDNQNTELARRITHLNARLNNIEHNLHTVAQLLSKIADQQQETLIHMLPHEQEEASDYSKDINYNYQQ